MAERGICLGFLLGFRFVWFVCLFCLGNLFAWFLFGFPEDAQHKQQEIPLGRNFAEGQTCKLSKILEVKHVEPSADAA